jgi:sporulation protein YlmC with PRC-barrel domain
MTKLFTLLAGVCLMGAVSLDGRAQSTQGNVEKPGERVRNADIDAAETERLAATEEPKRLQQPAAKPGERTVAPPAAASELSGELFRDREVLNASVVTLQGTSLGGIRDLLFDEATGQISYAVIRTPGILGIGSKLIAVPWDRVTYRDNQYRIDIDEAKFADAPVFDRDRSLDDSWAREIHAYYGTEPTMGRRLVRVSDAMDSRLFNREGERIGSFDSILIHPESGKVAYGVVDFDSREMPDRLTPVPWSLIRHNRADELGFVLVTSRDKIMSAPAFEEAHYNSPEWNRRVTDHYEARPYWVSARSSRMY